MMHRILLTASLSLTVTGFANAAEVGVVAAVSGSVEVRRASAGSWKAATTGAPLYPQDEFRTGDGGRAKLLFDDDSVVDLGRGVELTAKEVSRTGATVLQLAAGQMRVYLSDTAPSTNRSFEVETPTAVVRAEGTIFIVRYEPGSQLTEVYGVEGVVDVQGSIGLIGPTLKVGAGQMTRVQEGKFPEPVAGTDAAAVAALSSGLDLIGTGRADGIAATHPILKGAITRSDEKPAAHPAAAKAGAKTVASGVSYLQPVVPGETLIERLSPEARANTQPIPEYQFRDTGGNIR